MVVPVVVVVVPVAVALTDQRRYHYDIGALAIG